MRNRGEERKEGRKVSPDAFQSEHWVTNKSSRPFACERMFEPGRRFGGALCGY